jgi:3-isopropylmalate/(R)-2-methylmalate dehydratase small subunit
MVQRIAIIEGRGLPLRGDDIDTDRIIPGRFLKTVTFEGLEAHLFEDDRKAGGHPVDDPRYQGAAVLVVNANFGCGSSREHAPQALQRWGIQAIVGESFAEIFFGNSMMMGMPCLTASPADVRALQDRIEADPSKPLRIDLAAGKCEVDGVACAVTLPPKIREAFLTGAWDTTGMLMDRFDEVEATAARLPYVSGF